ncbi:MAG: TlpA disulfide reductase family protein [Bacteroidota bacterium]
MKLHWMLSAILCIGLGSCLTAQQNFNADIYFPSNLETQKLSIVCDTGNGKAKVPLDMQQGKLSISTAFYAPYAILEITYPSDQPNQFYKQSFLVNEKADATISFLETDLPLAQFKLVNALDLSEEGKSAFDLYKAEGENKLKSFFNKNGTALQSGNDSLSAIVDVLISDLNEIKLNFVKSNPDKYQSFLVFKDELIKTKIDPLVLTEVFESSFPKAYKKSKVGEDIRALLFAKQLKIGDEAPNIIATTKEGNEFELEEYFNKKPVLLVYWASWCQFCRAEIPQLKEVLAQYDKDEMVVVGISHDFRQDAWEKGIEKLGIEWVHLFNQPQASNAFAISEVPSFILIDQEGKIALKVLGYNEEHIGQLKEKLKETL